MLKSLSKLNNEYSKCSNYWVYWIMKNFLYYINFQNTRFLNDIFNLYNLNHYFLNIAINIIVFNNNYFLFSKTLFTYRNFRWTLRTLQISFHIKSKHFLRTIFQITILIFFSKTLMNDDENSTRNTKRVKKWDNKIFTINKRRR